jgi:hypothetical protein
MGNVLKNIATAGAIGGAAYGLYKKFAIAAMPSEPKFKFNGADTSDYRVKLIIPDFYLQPGMLTNPLVGKGGILFPYTPQITFEQSADYASANPTHSNFTVYSYKSSKISTISLTAKFTVQNDQDAEYYLAVLNCLRALTKMRQGVDEQAGAPPPVCRLNAYGPNMFNNVPVVITSFRTELPTEVDYYSSNQSTEIRGDEQGAYQPIMNGVNMVPTMSSITMSLLPMFSRKEMLNYNVTGWLKQTGKGYL